LEISQNGEFLVERILKPKVLVITTTFQRWEHDSIPAFINDFAQNMLEKCEVHVLAPHTYGAKKQELLNGVNTVRFVYAPEKLEIFGSGVSIMGIIKRNPLTILLIPSFVLSAAITIVRLLVKNKYDVVHVHWMLPFAPIVGIIRRFINFRFIVTSHGTDVLPFADQTKLINKAFGFVQKIFVLPKVDYVVPVSTILKNEIKKILPNLPDNKIVVVSMGINYSHFYNLASRKILPDPIRIVFVGRLAESKGVRYLIEAIKLLNNGGVCAVLQIFGDGLLRESFESQVFMSGLSNKVTFHGFVDHNTLQVKLADADFFVGPSITTSLNESEGFGLVFLEALAAGLVVIGTNVGGIPEIVIDGKTGVLIEEKSSLAIVDAVMLLIRNDELREKLILNGQRMAKKYDWSIIADKYFEIYGV
jgi:glycosyltransferase involved in cell wall biosynthesis